MTNPGMLIMAELAANLAAWGTIGAFLILLALGG
jgi:hypothetical protein